METTDAFLGLDCTETGERYDVAHAGRSDADAPLDPVYDYDALDGADVAIDDADSMWAFDAVLPVSADRGISASEGATPLVDASELADDIGVERLFVKDEGRNPTGTVLDRGLSLAVTMAHERGADLLALASPGNSGQSAAAYAERVGTDVYAFLPSRAPFPNKAMVNVHGGDMRVVGGRFGDALDALHDDLETDWYSLQEFTTPYRHEGIKTLAFEVAASLDWEVPDAVVVPTSTGEVVAGVAKGFRELATLGVVDDVPRLYAAQAEGCAPIVTAHERGIDEPEPWEHPDSICGELEIADPAGGALALQALDETNGGAVAVPDEDILESAVAVTQRLGTEVGATAGAAAAGVWELADDFDEDDTVVLVNTDAGVKSADILRSHLMGQGV